MLESDLSDLLSVEESLKVDDLWMTVFSLLFCAEQEGSGAICANRIADNRLECVIDVVASGADLDSQHQCPTARVCSNKICRTLQGGNRACTAKTDDGNPLHVLSDFFFKQKTAYDIWARVTRARADRQEIHILHASAGGLKTNQDRAPAGFQRTGQVAVTQVIGGLLAV